MATLAQNIQRAINDFNTIENAIVQKGVPVPDGTPTSEYAEKVEDVFEAGKKSEYDAFWDAYQLGGSRDYNYDFAFAGQGWSTANFKPKYSMKPLRCQNMFSSTAISGDLEQILANYGVSLDTSLSTFMTNFATHASNITVFPPLDISSTTGDVNLFQGCRALAKAKIISTGEVRLWTNNFNPCVNLVELTIEGALASNNLNISWSPLNKASLVSIVNALSDTTTGLIVTLRLDAVNTAFETTAGAADGSTSDEWTALIATKPNWTINLINS